MSNLTIPVRLIGPDGENLPLGNYTLVRTQYAEQLREIANAAASAAQTCKDLDASADDVNASMQLGGKLRSETRSLVPMVAKLKDIESHIAALNEGPAPRNNQAAA